MGTEVEPLHVGVPGNCCPGSRLRFDVRLCVHLCTLCVRRYQFPVRLHRSWLTPASGASVERFSYQTPRAREFHFLPYLLTHSHITSNINVLFHRTFSLRFSLSASEPSVDLWSFGQDEIGLLGAGGSKGDGPLPRPLDATASCFVPSASIVDSVLLSWNKVDNWSSLANPLSLFRRAYFLLATVDRISPLSKCCPRRFYRRVVSLMNAFRIRWNRRTRRSGQGPSPLREACNKWLARTLDC